MSLMENMVILGGSGQDNSPHHEPSGTHDCLGRLGAGGTNDCLEQVVISAVDCSTEFTVTKDCHRDSRDMDSTVLDDSGGVAAGAAGFAAVPSGSQLGVACCGPGVPAPCARAGAGGAAVVAVDMTSLVFDLDEDDISPALLHHRDYLVDMGDADEFRITKDCHRDSHDMDGARSPRDYLSDSGDADEVRTPHVSWGSGAPTPEVWDDRWAGQFQDFASSQISTTPSNALEDSTLQVEDIVIDHGTFSVRKTWQEGERERLLEAEMYRMQSQLAAAQADAAANKLRAIQVQEQLDAMARLAEVEAQLAEFKAGHKQLQMDPGASRKDPLLVVASDAEHAARLQAVENNTGMEQQPLVVCAEIPGVLREQQGTCNLGAHESHVGEDCGATMASSSLVDAEKEAGERAQKEFEVLRKDRHAAVAVLTEDRVELRAVDNRTDVKQRKLGVSEEALGALRERAWPQKSGARERRLAVARKVTSATQHQHAMAAKRRQKGQGAQNSHSNADGLMTLDDASIGSITGHDADKIVAKAWAVHHIDLVVASMRRAWATAIWLLLRSPLLTLVILCLCAVVACNPYARRHNRGFGKIHQQTQVVGGMGTHNAKLRARAGMASAFEKDTSFDYAAAYGDTEKDEKGYTSLHYAATYGDTESVRELLGNPRFDLANVRGGKHKTTALHHAARSGHVGATSLLLGSPRFTVLHAQDHKGRSALHFAAQSGHVPVVSELLNSARFEPALESVDFHGATALHVAAKHGHEGVAMVLASHLRFATVACSLDNHGNRATAVAKSRGFNELAAGLRRKTRCGAKRQRTQTSQSGSFGL